MAPLPVTAAQALLTSLGNEARSLFTTDNTPLFDPAGFLADPNTPPSSQIPIKALGRAVCRQWARRPGDSNNPAADRLYGGACGEYLDSIGERPEEGELGRPFSGGQCDGVCYQIGVTNRDGANEVIQARGPIGGVRGVTIPGGGRLEIFARSEVNFSNSTTCLPLQPPGWVFGGLGGTAWNADSRPRITFITRTDGGVDDCGDPPPEYQPPRPIIGLPPITPIFIDLPDVGEINVTVELFPDATFQLCSEDIDACVTIGDPTLNIGDGGGGGVDGGDLVPDGGLAGAPADTGNGGVAAGEAPEGQELVGIRVEVLESPIGVNTYDRVAVTVFRGIGYVRMGYPGRLALDMGGAAVISPQFFLAPVRGLTAWEVRANNGFINRVTPFYRELPS